MIWKSRRIAGVDNAPNWQALEGRYSIAMGVEHAVTLALAGRYTDFSRFLTYVKDTLALRYMSVGYEPRSRINPAKLPAEASVTLSRLDLERDEVQCTAEFRNTK